jgi:hypothetical protein
MSLNTADGASLADCSLRIIPKAGRDKIPIAHADIAGLAFTGYDEELRGLGEEVSREESRRRKEYRHRIRTSGRLVEVVSVSSLASAGASLGPECHRIFLLSPANVTGIRAGLLMNGHGASDLARRLRQEGAPLGELFSFMSSLYFRGKLAYARAFANPPSGVSGCFVITASGGLVAPDTVVTLERLSEISTAEVDPADGRYTAPLDRDARALAELAGLNCEIVLLGSIATPKYVDPLLSVFGDRLVVPAEFVGRGDMSRGGLMLRCVESGIPLTYVRPREAARHGVRPPKLKPLHRARPPVV